MTTASSAGVRPLAAQPVENPPNARRTMEALRELGYDSYASVLDLIDNSIDARASRISVTIGESKGDIVITVADDGCGMDAETLSEALRIGSDTEHDEGDLGKFGMGLVTASIGLSTKVEVVTHADGQPRLYGRFDLEEIARENRFLKWVRQAEIGEAAWLEHRTGTYVRLSNTDRISNRNTTTFANTLRRKIGQVFRKFLRAGGVKITVNGTEAEPFDPLMLSDPETKLVLEPTDINVDGRAVASLRVVELPDRGGAENKQLGIIAANSGFYILRNNREIASALTFDFFARHPNYAHFRAEIVFDGSADRIFHTDVKKTSITPSQSVLDQLKGLTQGLITQSSRASAQRSRQGKGVVDHSIAESAIPRRASLIPKPKTLIEKRDRKDGKGTHARGSGERERHPHRTDLKTVAGLKVVFNEAEFGESPFYVVEQEGRTITITYNREHPFWRELEEHADSPKVIAMVDYLVFAMANAELMVPEQAQIVKTNINGTLVGLLC